ncbi:MAG: quinoprotein relay system zinc metallohydrolase 2 [Nitrosomonadales bacterium]|nr:quinoprotein relay system zinc metallohydrolase 2 [Nitrosomonadales bacterium]
MPKLLFLLSLLFPTLALAAALPVEQIAAGVYVHRGEHKDLEAGYGGDICNISFVVGDKGIAVIDTGGSPRVGSGLREAIRKVSRLPILYVINTHVHPDHSLGNAAFKQDKPVFVGHGKLAEAMALRKETYLRNQVVWVGADAAGTEMIAPTLSVADTHEIDLGGRTLRLQAHPLAHSPTDLTVFDTASKTLWTGDLLFVERTPSIDGNIPNWLEVIEQLRTTPAAHFVAGHGSTGKGLSAALDDEKRYLGTLLNDVRAAIKQGLSMEQTIPTAARSEQGKWLLFDAVNRRNVALLYPQLEWE